MTEGASQPVFVSRMIGVPAQKIFDLLARPANHPLIDGSGMLRTGSVGIITGVGDVFTMTMHNDEMGDYEMANHVVEFEPGHRIGWEPALKHAIPAGRARRSWSAETLLSPMPGRCCQASAEPRWRLPMTEGRPGIRR
jgi:hypothetical protein